MIGPPEVCDSLVDILGSFSGPTASPEEQFEKYGIDPALARLFDDHDRPVEPSLYFAAGVMAGRLEAGRDPRTGGEVVPAC